jgi:Zn-dependent peptidase ImmA (M78 family)
LIIRGYIEPESLEKVVAEKLTEIGIKECDYPFNPYTLINNENIELKEVPIDNDKIKGMIVHGPNCTGILINSNRCFVSRRFTAMHELSHHWFHPHETQIVCFDDYTQQFEGREWQANHAAAYALMPTKLVIELYKEYYGDIDCLCSILKVSPESLGYRINEIGMEKLQPKKYFYNVSHSQDFLVAEGQWLYSGL